MPIERFGRENFTRLMIVKVKARNWVWFAQLWVAYRFNLQQLLLIQMILLNWRLLDPLMN